MPALVGINSKFDIWSNGFLINLILSISLRLFLPSFTLMIFTPLAQIRVQFAAWFPGCRCHGKIRLDSFLHAEILIQWKTCFCSDIVQGHIPALLIVS
jgi:hypothetical protein